ncbi:MAG: hypothetical protein BWZ02_02531 [Lentisphaerae bacterium ADurb.BinA184]|nr:MAG: hypothetical protein BWZ02_02531 [Lentisphaerae bacterium ADurb.BinA184]
MTELQHLRGHLARLRHGYQRRRLGVVLLATVTAVMALLLLFVSGDLLFAFAPATCWLAWGALLLTLVAGLAAAWRFSHRPISDAAVALMAERALQDDGNRLINAVQLAALQKDDGAFAERLLRERVLPVGSLTPHQLHSPRYFNFVLPVLAAVAALFAPYLLLAPKATLASLARLLAPMSDVQPYAETRICAVTPGDTTVIRGGDVPLACELAGILPRSASVEVRRDDGLAATLAMTAQEAEPGAPTREFRAGLQSLFYNCQYRVVAGDAASRWYTVQVRNPPVLVDWTAHVTPPAYVGRAAFTLGKADTAFEVPAGAAVVLEATVSEPLAGFSVRQAGQPLRAAVEVGGRSAKASFALGPQGGVEAVFDAANGLSASEILPLAVVADLAPSVTVVEPTAPVSAQPGEQVPVTVKATDDYGLLALGIERLTADAPPETLAAVPVEGSPRAFGNRFFIDLATLDAQPGDELRFRVFADDNAPDSLRNRAYSPPIVVRLPKPQDLRRQEPGLGEQAGGALLDIIRLQRNNLRLTRNLAEAAAAQPPAFQQITAARDAQLDIRDRAAALVRDESPLGDFRGLLVGLIEHEMTDAVRRLDEAPAAAAGDVAAKLADSATLQAAILAALTGVPGQLDAERRHQETVDLLEALRRLTNAQIENLKETEATAAGQLAADNAAKLARIEDRLSADLIRFTDRCLDALEDRNDADLTERVREVHDLFTGERLYERMVTAAEALQFAEFAGALDGQRQAVAILMRGIDLLNRWLAANAKERVAAALDKIAEIKDGLGELEQKQSKIAEVTKEFEKRGVFDDKVREELGRMDREQEAMGDLVEKLAQDLYQFPELPVCNELNSKMNEIFEHVEQAADSENAPSLEIAVQKEDSFLDAIRNTKKRVEDVEMWLPSVPDNIAWNMESFDPDEIPNIPLVPLPEELDDIVGDLLAQAEDIARRSQDATGNNMAADAEMGWDIMDGPIPNFSAKGKSGNTRPNDNEMTGRSGAGREGQANGELVENHVKGLEGTETHARRTRDPLQQGHVTEDEDSTLNARATGGGKLGGQSETEGMFGQAPRRDLHGGAHGTTPVELRRETEALYATARLLYMSTGSLGLAARELRSREDDGNDLQDFASLHRKVLRQLRDSQVEVATGTVLAMPSLANPGTGGASVQDYDLKSIGDEYRGIVSDYYKSLGSGQ